MTDFALSCSIAVIFLTLKLLQLGQLTVEGSISISNSLVGASLASTQALFNSQDS